MRILLLVSGFNGLSQRAWSTLRDLGHDVDNAPDPAAEGWANIQAINEVCKEIITCTWQTVIASYNGPAAAGGVMLGLGADVVAVRDGIILNPHYDIGLFGSELHTYTLPARVGADRARQLLSDKAQSVPTAPHGSASSTRPAPVTRTATCSG